MHFIIVVLLLAINAAESAQIPEGLGDITSVPGIPATIAAATTTTTTITTTTTTTTTAAPTTTTSSEPTRVLVTPTPEQSISTIATVAPTTVEDATSENLPEVTSYQNTSTFSCAGKITGYYADVKLACRVYHFCTQMDTIGSEQSYQRMSYICLEDSVFDQRDLNCVKEDQLKVPCQNAEAEYESSNKEFVAKEDSRPSISESLTTNIMMNPITRLIAGR